MKKILVLCHHNTARSQMAEGYLNFFAGKYAMVQSAGIEKKDLHPLAFEIMDEDNIDIKQHYPKLAGNLLNDRYDFLITIGHDLPKAIIKRVKAKRHLHLDLTDPTLGTNDIESSFRTTREIIKKFILKFIGQELMEPA